MPNYRTLRCANSALYLTAALMVVAAAIYVLCCKDALWQHITALLAIVITPIWAAHYAILRYTITPESITRRSLCGSTSLRWTELTAASLHETRNQATESCTIRLQAGKTSMSISSDLLPLDEVQELAEELKKCKLLH